MAGREFLRGLKKKPLIMNTCRGEVFDTPAVYQAIKENMVSGLNIDCWENEPELDLDLLDVTDYATSHIAGYSKDGKANGTKSSIRAISRFFGLGIDDWEPPGIEAPQNSLIELDGRGLDEENILAAAVLATYDIEQDDRALRDNPQSFEQLRGDYPVRREFDFYSVRATYIKPETLGKLEKLGFTILD